MSPASNPNTLSERVARVPAGTLVRLVHLRQSFPRWREAGEDGYFGASLGCPDRCRYFAAVGNDRALERLHAVLS